MFNLQFLGATETVTGSKYLIEIEDLSLLVDCGLFQGFKQLRLRNWAHLPIDIPHLSYVILTHAHIDHSGYIPLLVKNGFRGKIFCSAATQALCQILLPDSGYLQEEEARFANEHGFSKHKPAVPLYTREDAEKSLEFFEPIDWEKPISLKDQFSFQLLRAGHLLGAASVRLTCRNTSILFSGDLGRPNDPIMYPPHSPVASDYLIVESTYGDRIHENTNPKEILSDLVNRTIARGGSVLIPSFAVGRAQSVLYYLHQLRQEKQIPNVPIFLNSPMAINANQIFEKFHEDHQLSQAEAQAICDEAIYVNSAKDSQELNERKDPAIIIAASGMATGGRILHHLKTYLPNPKNSVLFVGFQAGGTRGEALIHGVDKIKIHGEYWKVKAEIKQIHNLSAHADSEEILSWLKSCSKRPRQVFLTHGESQSIDSLRKKIDEELHWDCHIPYYLEKIEL